MFRFLRSFAKFSLELTEPGSSSAHRYRLRTVAFAGGVGYIVGISSIVGAGEPSIDTFLLQDIRHVSV